MSLRRANDQSLVASDSFIVADIPNNEPITHVFNIPYTFVGDESDPYVTDGIQIYLEKSTLSTDGADMEILSTDFRLV